MSTFFELSCLFQNLPSKKNSNVSSDESSQTFSIPEPPGPPDQESPGHSGRDAIPSTSVHASAPPKIHNKEIINNQFSKPDIVSLKPLQYALNIPETVTCNTNIVAFSPPIIITSSLDKVPEQNNKNIISDDDKIVAHKTAVPLSVRFKILNDVKREPPESVVEDPAVGTTKKFPNKVNNNLSTDKNDIATNIKPNIGSNDLRYKLLLARKRKNTNEQDSKEEGDESFMHLNEGNYQFINIKDFV